jgi:Kdo2-lipid IVA lauroyltransferase/acyltransferase
MVYYMVLAPLSWLPMSWLYVLSNVFFFFLYHVFSYRKKVVLTNLRNAFPDYNGTQIQSITRKFYRHLCDVFVESIKLHSISRKEVELRMKCVNPELLQQYADRSVVLVGGHYSNWEWYAVFANLHTPQQAMALYTPIRNEFFNEQMKVARERHGIQMKNARNMASVYRSSLTSPVALIFATDQSPHNAEAAWWTTFLNQDTGVFMGTEHFAAKGNHPVIYGELRKPKRGHYEVEYHLISENPTDEPFGAITEAHTRALEATILKRPELWLWSHRRWKKQRPANANQPR